MLKLASHETLSMYQDRKTEIHNRLCAVAQGRLWLLFSIKIFLSNQLIFRQNVVVL